MRANVNQDRITVDRHPVHLLPIRINLGAADDPRGVFSRPDHLQRVVRGVVHRISLVSHHRLPSQLRAAGLALAIEACASDGRKQSKHPVRHDVTHLGSKIQFIKGLHPFELKGEIMGKVLKEIEVTLDTLAEFLDDAGWDVTPASQRLVFHTEAGVGFSIRVEPDRHFVHFGTHLPIRKDFEDHLGLVNTLNNDVFLGCFSIDEDKDLSVTYSMSYARGLILAQLSRILRRFAGMLDHVVSTYDKNDDVFAFGNSEPAASETPHPSLQ